MSNKRFCYHADESYMSPDHDEYSLIRVEEDTPGYLVVTHYPTLEEAKAQAVAFNEQLGLDSKDVLNIRASSMAASRTKGVFQAFVLVQFTTEDWHSSGEAGDLLAEEIRGLVGVTPTRVEVFSIQALVDGDD